jgi:hypothetical protein
LNAKYFKSETATQNCVLILNILYFTIKGIIVGIMFERSGMIYYLNKFLIALIFLPTILGILLTVWLAIHVLTPLVSIVITNVGVEWTKIFIRVAKFA